MAKERQSAAFKAFLGGANAVNAIQQRDAREEESSKARMHAEALAAAQRKAVAMNLKKQIDASNERQEKQLAQAATLHKEGLIHSAEQTTRQIQARLQNLRTNISAQQQAAQIQAQALLQYRTASSYDTARDTQLAFKAKGISGDVKVDDFGYARFAPTGDIEQQGATLESLGNYDKPTPSPLPDGGFFSQAARIMKDGIPGLGANLATEAAVREALPQGIQSVDLRDAEQYAKKLTNIISDDPQSVNDPRMMLAMSALDKIINRTNYSKKEVQSNIQNSSLRDIKAYIDMLGASKNN